MTVGKNRMSFIGVNAVRYSAVITVTVDDLIIGVTDVPCFAAFITDRIDMGRIFRWTG